MISQNAPTPASILLLLLLFFCSRTSSVDVNSVLSRHPDLSSFAALLSSTGVAAELDRRSSLTLLAVPNSLLRRAALPSAAVLPDVIRHHVILQYLSPSDLSHIPPPGRLAATLLQTTGRAAAELGDVTITSSAILTPSSNVTVLSFVGAVPYNISVFSVDGLLVPSSVEIATSDNQPSEVNVSEILVNARDFNVAAAMLTASGVNEELLRDQRGAGITVFVPADEAFARAKKTEKLQDLTAEKKAALLRFHVLHSYYPLGSLESIVNPVQPTLATEDSGAGRFTLNISRANGSVVIGSGLVRGSITRTVYDQNPVSVFGVSTVLLPRELFGVAAPAEAAAFPPEGGGGGEGPSVMVQASGAGFGGGMRWCGLWGLVLVLV